MQVYRIQTLKAEIKDLLPEVIVIKLMEVKNMVHKSWSFTAAAQALAARSCHTPVPPSHQQQQSADPAKNQSI